MKKTIMTALFMAVTTMMFSFNYIGKQVPTPFEIKADAFIDEIERLSLQSSEVDYSTLLILADALIKDPAFSSSWAAYCSQEQEQRLAFPFQCIQNASSSYSQCVAFWHGNPPPAVPPYGTMNDCQYHLITDINHCIGLPPL